MKYVIIVVVVGLLLLGAGYLTMNHDQSKNNKPVENAEVVTETKLNIVASFYPLQYAAQEIVGELGEVANVGEGRDPHDVQLSSRDVLKMQQADLVVIQGADLEPWGDDTVERLEADGVAVYIATEGLILMEGGEHTDHGDEDEEEHEEEEDDEDEHDEDEEGAGEEHEEDEDEHGAFDPHTWLDPVLFGESVAALAEAIAALDPQNAAVYRANAAALQSELAALNVAYSNRLANCSIDEVITSHDAFGYIAERYGFEIHAIAGLSTQDVPSATILAELREEAKEGIGAILLEESSVTAYGETLARETGLQTLSINPIAYVIPDGDNYLTLMQSNLDVFVTALACNE